MYENLFLIIAKIDLSTLSLNLQKYLKMAINIVVSLSENTIKSTQYEKELIFPLIFFSKN